MRSYDQIKRDLDYLYQGEDSENKKPQDATHLGIITELLLDCREVLLVLRDGSGEELWGDDLLELLEDEEEDVGPEDVLPPVSPHGI